MPLHVTCPACQLAFGLPDEMAGRWITCPSCATGFAAGTDQPLPHGYEANPPPVRRPSYDPPAYDDDDDEPIRPRSSAMPLVVALLFALGVATIVLIVVAVNRTSEPSHPVARSADTERPSPRGFEADTHADHVADRENRILGILTFWFILWVILGILYLASLVLILAWVAKDTRARNVDGGAMWVFMIFMFGWIGLLVYLASRPHGNLMLCGSCNNRRLQASKVCPHCGNA